MGKETQSFKGGGPYWILLQPIDRAVVKPMLVKPLVDDAKILYISPQYLHGFEFYFGHSSAGKSFQRLSNSDISHECLDRIGVNTY